MAPSPDRAAGEEIADAVPSSSHGKRGRGKRTTSESKRVAKLARALHVEETKAQEEDNTETPTTNVEERGATQDTRPAVANTTENIVKLLVKDLQSHDRDVTEKALTDLADLCHEDATDLFEANEREIRRLGGHMAVVQAVKMRVDDALIQEEGIRAIWNLSYQMPAKVLVGDIGGVEVILAGMKRHPEDVRLQRVGCGAIANLSDNTKRNAERFEESDGIAAVIAAMEVHDPENEDVQLYSCVVLKHLCEWAEYRPLIVAAGGAATIAYAMKEYSDNPRVREAAQDAMQELVKRD